MDDYQRFLQTQRQRILEHVTPSKEAEQLKHLLNYLVSYQFSIRGYPLTSLSSLPPHQLDFPKMPISLELATEIDYRLKLLGTYQLAKGQRISQLLLAGLHTRQPPSFSQLQVDYLSAVHQDPRIGILKLAKKIGSSPRTINQERDQLFHQYGVRVASMLDPHQFGLVHLGVQFRTKAVKVSPKLKARLYLEAKSDGALPFLQGFAFDINQRDGVFTSFLPNQVRTKNKFDRLMQEFHDLFFEEFSINYIQGFFTNLNFGSYNHLSQEWHVTSDLRTEGTRQFIEKYGFQFPAPRGFTYKQQRLSFGPTDWILMLGICEGLLERKEREALLAQYGFPLAYKTVWAHEHRLKKAQAFFPFLAFSRLFFDEIIFVRGKCEPSTMDFLHQFATQFPMSRLHPTRDGIILFIGVPRWGSSLTKQLTHTLLDMPGFSDVRVLRLKRVLPHVPAIHTHALWNPKTEHWNLPGPSKA